VDDVNRDVAYLDDIANLQDPELFFNKIGAEVGARTPPKNGKRQPPALNNSSFVAGIVATRYVEPELVQMNVLYLFEYYRDPEFIMHTCLRLHGNLC
jgi:hypothetical protein